MTTTASVGYLGKQLCVPKRLMNSDRLAEPVISKR